VSSPPPSPEDGNRSSFRNVVFFGIQDDGKSPEKFCEFCTSVEQLTVLRQTLFKAMILRRNLNKELKLYIVHVTQYVQIIVVTMIHEYRK
jgi:hypothetical protein